MENETRKEIISDYNGLLDVVEDLRRKYSNLVDFYGIHQKRTPEETALYDALNSVYRLQSEMTKAIDGLKSNSQGAEWIEKCARGWYDLHIEDNDAAEIPAPTVESVEYKGNNCWHVKLATTTEGRLLLIYDSDGANWEQLRDYHEI